MNMLTCAELDALTDADMVRMMMDRWPEEQAYRRGVKDVFAALALYLPDSTPETARLKELMDALADRMLDIIVDQGNCHALLVDTLFADGMKIVECFRKR